MGVIPAGSPVLVIVADGLAVSVGVALAVMSMIAVPVASSDVSVLVAVAVGVGVIVGLPVGLGVKLLNVETVGILVSAMLCSRFAASLFINSTPATNGHIRHTKTASTPQAMSGATGAWGTGALSIVGLYPQGAITTLGLGGISDDS
jgi:hypothetical protein